MVAALLVEDDGDPAWLLANLGDSRIYAVAGGELRQVSVDHSVVQELRRLRRDHRRPRRTTTRSGTSSPARWADRGWSRPTSSCSPVTEVERLLLCTDGISGLVDDDRIAAILTESSDPRDAADRLVAAALEAGGDDNATAVVVDVVGLVPDQAYDSERQRASLEQKLGALP